MRKASEVSKRLVGPACAPAAKSRERAAKRPSRTALDSVSRERGRVGRLLERLRFLRAVTENILSSVGYWDADLRCTFANATYRQWYGPAAEPFEGRSMREVLPADAFAVAEPYVANALGGLHQTFEQCHTRPDGATRFTTTHFIPDISAAGDAVRGFYVLVSDTTDIKETQLRLATLNEALRARTTEAEAASIAKSRFLANMSHEIRSPLNALSGMLQLLQTSGLSLREADYAQKAAAATKALVRLLDDILDFSKVEAGKLTIENAPFEIDAMMWHVSALLSATLNDKPVELLFVIDERLPKAVLGDEFRLRQVLLNLAGNAIKFTAFGEIVVEIRQVAAGRRRDIAFSVQDTGIGIPTEQQTAIFEGFNQGESSTTRRFGGSGLGLAISAHLVALMGGELMVESESGRGSRFHFTLSMEPAPEDAVAASPRPASLPSNKRVRVLIVDDNERARAALAKIVQSFGWEADVAGAEGTALELIRGSRAECTYGAVFIDSTLPGDTVQTARAMRAALPVKASIIVMGFAHALNDIALRARTEPNIIDAVLVKPVTASAFIKMVTELRAQRKRSGAGVHRAQAPRLGGLKILVIDDNAVNLQIASELLASEGADVAIADAARVGIAQAQRADPPFDLVLMDVAMPDMDGYEATRRLRAMPETAGTAVVAMTANAMAHDRAACLSAGMDGHVPKPIDLDLLVATIRARCGPAKPAAAVDVAAALTRLGNNQRLFKSLAERFVATSGSLVDDLRARVRAGAVSDTARLLHHLKGLAGTLGLDSLAEAAARLEAAVKRTSRLPDADDIARLEAVLVAGNAVIGNAVASFASPAPAHLEPTLERDAIARMLAEIDVLLGAADLRAVARCADLQRGAGVENAVRLQPLVEAIDRLDFRAAGLQAAQLRAVFP